ncbi:MAG: DUF6531 domain-containing protein, partial [Pseudomonadales bacterium]
MGNFSLIYSRILRECHVTTKLIRLLTVLLCGFGAVAVSAQVVWQDQRTTLSTTTSHLDDIACDLAEGAGFSPCASMCLWNGYAEGNGDSPPIGFIPSGHAYLCKKASDSVCNNDYGNPYYCGFSAYRIDPGPEKEKGSGTCPEEPHSPSPIYFASGNKFLSEQDYKGTGSLPLGWGRTYNSLDKTWRFSYSQSLTPGYTDEMFYRQADGRGIRFIDPGLTGNWTPDSDIAIRLDYDALADEWKITLKNDAVETFNSEGELQSITSRAGQTITFGYTNNRLTTITHFSGRSLTLTYDNEGRVTG